MTYTTHGHHIPGTDWGNAPSEESMLCGGPKECQDCKEQVNIFVGTPEDYPAKAKQIVRNYVVSNNTMLGVPDFSVYVVWFSYILGGWKALVSTTLADGWYYEVTYNATKHETYLDGYPKYFNIVIPDEDMEPGA